MRAIKYFLLLLLLGTGLDTYSQKVDSVFICSAEFTDTTFNNDHAGSGFLIEHEGKYYLCTAKHVLYFAKTDKMDAISFGEELKAWKMRSKSGEKVLLAGQLLNENTSEKLNQPLQGDWLIFEYKGALPDHAAIYQFRSTPLQSNEYLECLGFPYEHQAVQALRIKGSFVEYKDDWSFVMNVPRGTYNGCSGGPVIDKEGRLVGLVSMGYYNEEQQKMIFEPASINYFLQIIDKQHPILIKK